MSSDSMTMFDTIYNRLYPHGARAYAGYVDGHVGDQPNYRYIVETFPAAQHLSMAVFARDDADMLDIEQGAAFPEDAAAWYSRQRHRGLERPCLYASVSEMAGFVVPVIEAARIPRSQVRLWSAHFGAGEHICGPGTCGLISIGMDGTQWTDTVDGQPVDKSLLHPGFFTVPAPKPPRDWTYTQPLHLTARAGHTSVALSWDLPAGAPVPPARYHVYIYDGVTCVRSTLAATYPRGTTDAETAARAWEGGSLQRGRSYTAHVVAAGPGGTHVRPYTYASAQFTTG